MSEQEKASISLSKVLNDGVRKYGTAILSNLSVAIIRGPHEISGLDGDGTSRLGVILFFWLVLERLVQIAREVFEAFT